MRVLTVHSDTIASAYLRAALTARTGVEIAAEVRDVEAAAAAVRSVEPDLVLVALDSREPDCRSALEALRGLGPAPPVVAIAPAGAAAVVDAVGDGVSGIVSNATPPGDLPCLVRLVASGYAVFSSEPMARITRATRGGAQARRVAVRRIGALSTRETEVLAGIGHGRSNADIATRTELSEATVKGYVSKLLKRLRCDNRTQIALLGVAAGLVDVAAASSGTPPSPATVDAHG